MKKAIQYVSGLNFENMSEQGLSKISTDMDSFSSKEQFEVLLVIFARFLGTIEFSDSPENSAQPAQIESHPVESVLPPESVQPLTQGVSIEPAQLSDVELERALANLPVEAEHTEADKAAISQYRARFAKRG